MGKSSPYGRKEWHRKRSGNKSLNKGIDAAFRGAGAVGKAAGSVRSQPAETKFPAKYVFISLAVGLLAFFIASASCGIGVSFFCGIVGFWVALFIFSITYGTVKGIKDGLAGIEQEDESDGEELLYVPNPEWMGQTDLVDSRANARVLAPQFLKQAQESAKILQTTTEPATFFTRYDFCVGRLMELEKCKKYGAPVSATADLKKYRSLSFRDDAVKEIIHRTEEKYQAKIEGLKTAKAKQNWAQKYHQAFEPYLPYMTDGQKSELGEASAYLFDLAQK